MNDFLPKVGEWFMTNIVNVAGLTLVFTIFAVIIAFIAIWIAWMTYDQIGREEPWSLTKLDEEHWLLERVHRKIATISREEILPHCSESCIDHYMGNQSAFMTPTYMLEEGSHIPSGDFKRGTKIVVKISKPHKKGSFFTLYYREYSRYERTRFNEYDPDSSHGYPDGVPAGIKKWSTPIY